MSVAEKEFKAKLPRAEDNDLPIRVKIGGYSTKGIKDHVVIVGIGNVGFKILKELIKMEYEVTIIDKSTEEGRDEFEEFQKNNRIPTIYGDDLTIICFPF